MLRKLALLLAVLCATPVVAEPNPAYYGAIDTSSAATLRVSLHAVIDDHTRTAYDGGVNWTILEAADQDPNNSNSILDFYQNNSYPKVTGRGGSYNREHVWSQSLGFPDSSDTTSGLGYYPRTDMHHLFLTDAGYNSTRSNNYFDFAITPRGEYATILNGGEGGGSGTYPGNSNWLDANSWEVWNDRRGDAARALFYMDVRYEGGTHSITGTPEPDLILTDNPALIVSNSSAAQNPAHMGLLTPILTWAASDGVDSKERVRMEVIAASQGNRNPFVDYPEWAPCLFAGTCGTIAPGIPQNLVASSGDAQVALDWADRIETDLAGYNVYRASALAGPYMKINATLVSASNFADLTAANGQAYYYRLTALDTAGNESGVSAARSAAPIPAGGRVLISQQSFETGADYTVTGATGTFASGTDYFDRFTVAGKPAGLTVNLTNIDGAFFIAGEDTNGSSPSLPSNGIHTITLDAVSTSAFSNLRVAIALNSSNTTNFDTAALSNGDYLRVFVSTDGGADTLIGQFTKVGASASNGAFGQDTNLDGLGDANLPTYLQLTDFTFDLPDLANGMVVKVVTRFESGDEEIVYDNVRILGYPITRIAGWQLY